MGKTILTPTQYHILQLAAASREITNGFYFTGGTALSEFYLHHRLSEDLDFFSDQELEEGILDSFIKKAAKKLHGKNIKWAQMGMFIYTLTFPNHEEVKIDFNHQPFKQLERGVMFQRLEIASLWDIAVDKLYTIFHRLKARDFVDLYFAVNKIGCSLEQLIAGLEEKYEMTFERISLISRFPSVTDLTDYPTMLVPFDRKEMEDFFLKLVKSMESTIFE